MISLTLKFEQGRLVEVARENVPAAAVRPRRRVEGQPGLYHRIVGPQGEVLFENLVPDPRRVPWDTSDDGKTLRGGVATLNDMPLNLRLPASTHGKLQVYAFNQPNWLLSEVDKAASLVGEFDL